MNAHHALSDGFTAEGLIPLVVPTAMFGSIVVIVAVWLYFRYRTQDLRQDLYRSYLEKGEPIPPSLLSPVKPKSRHGDLRVGLFLLTGGVGLSISLLLAHQMDGAPFGLIPALIGLGFLVVWKVESSPPADAPERS
jgi:hypothetical protein